MAETFSVSVPDDEEELIDWVEAQVDKKRFSNKSHAIRYCIHQVKEGEKRDVIA